MYNAVKSMYEDVKARVLVGGDLTEVFCNTTTHSTTYKTVTGTQIKTRPQR